MINLGTTDFYIGVPSLPRQEFEEYSTRLFDAWEAQVEKTLSLSDYSLELQVEEGSVKGAATIGAAIMALYIGIGNYGSFISGLQAIRAQVDSAGEFLAERSQVPFRSSGVAPKIRKRGGSLSHLQRLFFKVQNREMTVEQAMQEAQVILGDEATTAPEFLQKLEESLAQMPLSPHQLLLEHVEQEDQSAESDKERVPRSPRPKPSLPPPQQLRVTVWRESKKGKREVRVIEI